ncbi:hypothetical protein MMMB2_1592 [Mycobacterium marinum MB2]|nr:hypothetical protein MMMB2_1592 [Mycobacterium marinum MB2]
MHAGVASTGCRVDVLPAARSSGLAKVAIHSSSRAVTSSSRTIN